MASFLGVGTGLVALSSLEGILVPLQNDLVLSVDDINVLTLAVAAGSLLILFVAGSLVDRLGTRRILRAGACAAVVGAIIVSVAPALPWILAGRVVGGIGATAMSVAALALLNEQLKNERERAYVFGLFAAFTGVVFTISPVLSSLIAERLTWRLVPLLWIAFAAGAALLLPRLEHVTGGRREMLTPLAAGVTLSGLSLAALVAKDSLVASAALLAVVVAAALIAVLRWRWLRGRDRTPGLDVSVFSAPGAKPLMGAMLTVAAVNLFFYGSLFLQYRLGLSPAQTALILVIPQAAGILGGLAGGWVSARIGSTRTTAIAFAIGCAAALSFVAVQEPTTWSIVIQLAFFAAPAGCVTGTLTKAFLDCADPAASGAAASWRQGAWNLGATLGGAATGAIVLSYFVRTWTSALEAAGLDSGTAQWAADAVRAGLPLSQIASSPVLDNVAGREAVQTFVGLTTAQLGTFRLIALLAAVAYAVSLALVLIAMWRKRVAA
jgi:DHA2 family multidrug resistance protein-like MFS transporter